MSRLAGNPTAHGVIECYTYAILIARTTARSQNREAETAPWRKYNRLFIVNHGQFSFIYVQDQKPYFRNKLIKHKILALHAQGLNKKPNPYGDFVHDHACRAAKRIRHTESRLLGGA
ncbi:MAG: hypothetical protein JO171_13650 [Paludibacterium sp.]|uniref:hypothetical protein n=1 Tax=Paludibacterium sp. TaxID=1917523 RepID=UPI0025F517A3|nr:hypothetical protein [Paludibacterium sp.]MBV8048199.1 hypothetical protein [Paludibacterium sp.]MBV8646961.1 hypothetical protein [Paludibacterium sp.]